MAAFSDHKKPAFEVNKYLPEVYRSDVNSSVFNVAFDRHLTKDDTARVAGFIGQKNAQALVDRQVKEATPHRQAFQLAPTVVSTVGTTETTLSFKSFLSQLAFMGVDVDRIQSWGSAQHFNWAPPVNIDMLINYQDYFWKSEDPRDPAQYFTVENRCNKAQSRVQAYANTLSQRGDAFAVTKILYGTDHFVITGKQDDLFTEGFEFYTTGTSNPNLFNKRWTVAGSSFSGVENTTTIAVVESIANAANVAPTPTFVGQWWYDTSAPTLKEWNGITWVSAVQALAVTIDLTQLLEEYKLEANCVCDGSYGWDAGKWDAERGLQWDTSDLCVVQEMNQWSKQNKWIHKSQVQSFSDVRRAQVPIFEYNSTAELNEWTERSYAWKYRETVDAAFTATSHNPSRFELEPIKGFAVANDGGVWRICLFGSSSQMNRDTDFSSTFSPGFKFRITDDTLVVDVYTVSSVEYRQIVPSDPSVMVSTAGVNHFCTIVTLEETTFTSFTQGGGVTNVRIEPLTTSRGDVWRGYHVHWVLDVASTTAKASGSHTWNHFLSEGLTSPPPLVAISSLPSHADDGEPFTPQATAILISTAYQEVAVDVSNVTRVDLVDQLRFNPTTPHLYATPGSNELRVYVNGVRQYGNYTEVVGTATPSYTLVGQSAQTSQQIQYVQAVVFEEPLVLFDTVRIEVGPAAQEDSGMFSVPVRTVEDEMEFTLGTVNGTQPAYMSLVRFQKQEQVKRAANQYPLFNVYGVVTSDVIKASCLFGFAESSSAAVNSSVGRRIVASSDGREYQFEQFLLDRDDNIIYGFRNLAAPPMYWYSPLKGSLQRWDGRAWDHGIMIVLTSGASAKRTPHIKKTPPAAPLEGDMWVDVVSQRLYQYDGSTWSQITDVVVSDSDPTIETVWKPGTTNKTYVPSYVDENRTPIVVGSADGDWEVVDQWMYNPEHHNKRLINYSQLITHFRTILAAQQSQPGLTGGGVFTLEQNNIDYGVGGTIKEHNDGFDTLISAVNVSNVTPVGVIEFAQREYDTALQQMRDLFNKSLTSMLTTVTPASLRDLASYVSSNVIASYESNDFTARVYGDTVSYANGRGVRNWIATIPMLGLGPLYRPHMTVDSVKEVRILHHDGHRSSVKIGAVEMDRVSRSVCGATDVREPNGKFGVVSSLAYPTTPTSFVTSLGSFRSGVFWYYVNGGVRRLSRFQPYAISPAAPSVYDETGAEIADGVMYYNTSTATTYKKQGLSWVAITVVGAGNIAPLWVDVELSQLLGSVILEVEHRLYDVTPSVNSAFDYSSLTPTPSELAVHKALMRQRFGAFLTTRAISTPFVNKDYTPTAPFTWNYTGSTVLTPPRSDITPLSAASWQEVYTRWYGTPYPHLEPWALQGYRDKPTWWDAEYKDTSGTRRWLYNHGSLTGMWENIRVGVVPAGKTYPDGTVSSGNTVVDGQSIPSYAYFSVNISDSAISGGYAPDDLLPPYYDNAAIVGTLPTVRSLFATYTTEVYAPSSDYVFGDVGPAEWEWLVSSQYPYDNPVTAFLMQPVRFLHSAFGPQYVTVNELQVERVFKQVYSHEDVLFHGDVYDTNKTYIVRGLNQWYVNFNRFNGFDTNGEFRQLWAGWKPQLTYQFAGIIDTSTFEISNRFFELVEQDYKVILANSGIVRDVWVDTFNASLLSVPPALVQYNNQAAWKIELNSVSPTPREIKYHGVKSYQFSVDTTSNVCTAFSYPIVQVNSPMRCFSVLGDYTQVFLTGTSLVVAGSSFNNGTYTVMSSTYVPSTGQTCINVSEHIPVSAADGTVSLSRSIPWQTGDEVAVSSSKLLCAPLLPGVPYYVIRLTSKTFKLAETRENAINGIAIDITSSGVGVLRVSQVDSEFQVFGGVSNTQDVWYHYAIDETDVRSFSLPFTVNGMQTLIDIIDGYASYQQSQGIPARVADVSDFDPDTGRQITWGFETERFIDWAYGLRNSRAVVADRFNVSVNTAANTMTFTTAVPMWPSGTAVVVNASGELPSPLVGGEVYYVVNTSTSGTVQLSTSANATDSLAIVDLATTGMGQVSLALYNRTNTFPTFELNPTRNNLWVNTPLGVLSNITKGPYGDARVQQTIYDQYGRSMGPDKVVAYREDQRNRIAIRPNIVNDVDVSLVDDPYHYIHIGGAHLFVEGYEHYLVFNNYTTGGSLVYDPFLGLSSTRFSVDYFEKEDYTLRPTLGGFYLLDQQFLRNMEGSISDVRNFYDTLELSETSDVARRSRALLGYRGRTQFLDFLNINSKSQFLFYKGLIQTKGSVNSVKAYINSRRFVDAKLDEFWAWKIADFGDSRVRVYPEVKLFSTDGRLDDVRLEFLATSEVESDPDVVSAVADGFQVVSFNDSARWNSFPEQKNLIGSPLFLDTKVQSMTLIYSGEAPPPPGTETNISFWFNRSTNRLYAYDAGVERWITDVTAGRVLIQTVQPQGGLAMNALYYRLDSPCDDVRVIHRSLTSTSIAVVSATTTTFVVAGDRTADIAVGVPFAVQGSTNKNGAYYPSAVSFNGTVTTITVPAGVTPTGTLGSIEIEDFNQYTTELYSAGTGEKEVTRVDSEVVRFNLNGFDGVIMLFALVPATDKLNPAKLIDVKSNTLVQQVPLWDPARGQHSPTAIHNVDIQSNRDPARYKFAANPTNTTENFWNQKEVGTVWLDTANLGYVSYYDDRLYPDVNERLYKWGKLAPWAQVKTYRWTRSTVPPASWDALVVAHRGDSQIPQNEKATGTPRKVVLKRTRASFPVTLVNVGLSRVTIPGSGFVQGDVVVFTATSMPGGLENGVKYIIQTTPTPNVYTLVDPNTEDPVVITSAGSGVVAVPAFNATDWDRQTILHDRTYAPFAAVEARTLTSTAPGTLVWPYTLPQLSGSTPIVWTPSDPASWAISGTGADAVDVYINDVLVASGLPVSSVGSGSSLRFFASISGTVTLNEHDIIDVVRPVHVVTSSEEEFDPDVADDGSQMIQWKSDYEYSSSTTTQGGTNVGSTTTTYYYFWVEDSSYRDPVRSPSLSTQEITQQLTAIPTPYFVVQRPKDDPYLAEKFGFGMVDYGSLYSLGVLTEADYRIPVLYREAIVRKVASYINDDDRYIVRFTRDWALRDNLEANGRQMNLKERHQEWFLFRREQMNTIPRELWDRLTESLAGYKLSDSSVRVPSLDRELYDATHGTSTRYGLGKDQTFVDRTLGLNTIRSYLQNPLNDFSPTDIDAFLTTYTFDTPANVIAAMDVIYTSFSAQHVNALWFETLSDALSTQAKYKELMKTSWIALHGIRVLEVGGLFDD